ncbi:hypothetical protein U1Q18_024506, partial [Sarracenia purpurea var. burkii]
IEQRWLMAALSGLVSTRRLLRITLEMASSGGIELGHHRQWFVGGQEWSAGGTGSQLRSVFYSNSHHV